MRQREEVEALLWEGRRVIELTPIERNVVLLTAQGMSAQSVAAKVGSLTARQVEDLLADLPRAKRKRRKRKEAPWQ